MPRPAFIVCPLQFMLPTGGDEDAPNVTSFPDLSPAVPSLNTVTVMGIMGSFTTWCVLYFIMLAVNGHKGEEWNCRAVTMLHGLIAANAGLISVMFTGPWPFDYIGQPNLLFHTILIIISLGYFMFDFAWCVKMKTEGPLMLVHHLLSIYGFFHVLYSGYQGCEMVAVLGGSESTNPLLQFRWFVKEIGYYDGWLEYAIDSSFVVIFALFRVGCGTPFLIHFTGDPNVTTFAKIGGFSFYLVSVLFMTDLLKYSINKYTSGTNSHTRWRKVVFYFFSTVVLSCCYVGVPYTVISLFYYK